MAVRIVRLGTERHRGEGLRIGTVRRPPRGVKKENYAREDWYDVWLPSLAPSAELMSAIHSGKVTWSGFARKFRTEMQQPDAARFLDVLAALSHSSDFSVGCYCEDEAHCHRSLLRSLLEQRGARIED